MRPRFLLITAIVILSFHAHANIPLPLHFVSSIPVSKEAKEDYSHCMDEAQNFVERKSCGKQLVKRLVDEADVAKKAAKERKGIE